MSITTGPFLESPPPITNACVSTTEATFPSPIPRYIANSFTASAASSSPAL